MIGKVLARIVRARASLVEGPQVFETAAATAQDQQITLAMLAGLARMALAICAAAPSPCTGVGSASIGREALAGPTWSARHAAQRPEVR